MYNVARGTIRGMAKHRRGRYGPGRSLVFRCQRGRGLRFASTAAALTTVLLRFFRTINCTVVERETVVGDGEKVVCTPLKHRSLLVKTIGIDTVCVCVYTR